MGGTFPKRPFARDGACRVGKLLVADAADRLIRTSTHYFGRKGMIRYTKVESC
jgi:hypothetical protein